MSAVSPLLAADLKRAQGIFCVQWLTTNSAQRAFSCSVGEAIGQAKNQAVKGSSAVPQSEARG